MLNIYFTCVTEREGYVALCVRSWSDGSLDLYFIVDPLSYVSVHPVIHSWCNKGSGMCYPVCGIAASRERVAHEAAAGFLSLFECSFIT